jgi:hypothetical protein
MAPFPVVFSRALKSLLWSFGICFFVSCLTANQQQLLFSHEITLDERAWMEKFFDDLLFVEGGVYTLWGSKPITEIVLYHHSQEEIDEMQRVAPEENLENCYIVKNYDLPENWERWEKISSRFPLPKYLLFRSHYTEDRKISFIYFVNILRTASVIEENYEIFQRAVGFDFHPLEVVLEMPNQDSIFWKKIRSAPKSPVLWGLLFGYGKANAYAFYWKHFDSPACETFFSKFPNQFSHSGPNGKTEISFKNFEIPAFASFGEEDEMVIQYEKERQKIHKIYRGRDHLDLTLQKLTQ